MANLVLPDGAALAAETRPDLLGGVVVITGEAEAVSEKAGKIVGEKKPVTLIPYYAWANRGKGEMAVWLAREPGKARVAREPGLSAKATVTASERAVNPKRANDQFEPESSDDAAGYMHWWPKTGTAEWIEYAFDAPVRVSEASVYWFDDTGGGGCRVPASWRVLYKSGGGVAPGQGRRRLRRGQGRLEHGQVRARPDDGPSPRGPAPGELVGRRPRVEDQVGSARIRSGSARPRGA